MKNIRVEKAPAFADVSSDEIVEFIVNPTDRRDIYNGRNTLWAATFRGQSVVVKQFRSGLKSRIVYALFSSKASRSLRNAVEISRRGIDTPAPVASAEWRGKCHGLLKSYYICEETNTISLAEAFDRYGRETVEAFAAFVAELHEKGIRHDDLNNTNVRVARNADGTLTFSLIDLNRMKLYDGPVPLARCFRNMCRFSRPDENFKLFLREYLRIRKLPEHYYDTALAIKLRHEKNVTRKKRLKSLLRPTK